MRNLPRPSLRSAAYTGFRNGPPPGACLLVNSTGAWFARAGAAVLASGALPGGAAFDPTQPRTLAVALSGTGFAGSVDGASLFAATLPAQFAAAGGLVGLGCGYHSATFDDFSIVASA